MGKIENWYQIASQMSVKPLVVFKEAKMTLRRAGAVHARAMTGVAQEKTSVRSKDGR